MGGLAQLVDNGLVDFRPAVTMHIEPHRRVAIVISLAVGSFKVNAVCGLNEERLLGLPVLHLRERVPEIAAFDCGKGIAIHHKVKTFARLRIARWPRPDCRGATSWQPWEHEPVYDETTSPLKTIGP